MAFRFLSCIGSMLAYTPGGCIFASGLKVVEVMVIDVARPPVDITLRSR